MSNWAMALDSLAASGVIDFDAPAFILGQPPRYAGHPNLDRLPLEDPAYMPHGVKMKNAPSTDSYDGNKNLVQNPTWKKLLFGGVAIGGALLVGASILATMGKIKLPSSIKLPKIKMPKLFSKITNKISKFVSKIMNLIKKPFPWIKGKFPKP